MTALDTAPIPADFGFTEEHELARRAARKFLADRCPMTEVRRLATDDAGFDEGTWRGLADLGWIGLTAPESIGGAGLDHLHLGLLAEEMGRCLLPSPYLGSVMALDLLVRSGTAQHRDGLAAAVASGSSIGTVALTEPDPDWDPAAVKTTATVAGSDVILEGTKTHVLFGSRADVVLVPARENDGGIGVYAVELPRAGVVATADVPLDTTRRTARIVFRGARVPRTARLDGDGLEALRGTHVLGFVLLACEASGAQEALLGITRDYAAERQQFGRAIASFQAVKHPIVDMMVNAELLRSQALAAASCLTHAPSAAEVPARMAKALASDTFAFAARKAVQLHGGFGFTWDCDVHFYFKRALWTRGTLGDAMHHRRRLAATMFAT